MAMVSALTGRFSYFRTVKNYYYLNTGRFFDVQQNKFYLQIVLRTNRYTYRFYILTYRIQILRGSDSQTDQHKIKRGFSAQDKTGFLRVINSEVRRKARARIQIYTNEIVLC